MSIVATGLLMAIFKVKLSLMHKSSENNFLPKHYYSYLSLSLLLLILLFLVSIYQPMVDL
jgi:hypothetical protein